MKVEAWRLVPGAWIFLDDRTNPVMAEKVEHGRGQQVEVTLAGATKITYGRVEIVEVVG